MVDSGRVPPISVKKTFKPGNTVVASGVYYVRHPGHRLAHEATILAGEVFPKCKECGLTVRFKIIRALAGNENPVHAPFHEILVPFKDEDRLHRLADVEAHQDMLGTFDKEPTGS